MRTLILLIAMVLSAPAMAELAYYNNCDSLDAFIWGQTLVASDVAIKTGVGPDDSNCLQLVPRDQPYTHYVTWNFNAVNVGSGDTLTFDVQNWETDYGVAHLYGWCWMDDGAGGEFVYCPSNVNGALLDTENWVHFTVQMPSSTYKLKRIQFTIDENIKIIRFDNLKLVPSYVLDTSFYQYGDIYNPCDDVSQLTFCEGGITNDLNGNHACFIPRDENSHTMTWNIGEISVIPGDFMTFDVKNDMDYGNATLGVNLSWRDSENNTGVVGPAITGLTNGHLIDSSGWKRCRIAMPDFPCTITNITFWVDENIKIVYVDNLAINPTLLPQDCNQVQQNGLALTGDINGDCHVDMKDFNQFAATWLHCTTPGDSSCSSTTPVQTGTIIRGTATVDGDISEWANQVEWVTVDNIIDRDPNDVTNAKFGLRWNESTNKIYAAVVVTDTAHYFTDDVASYWDASDRIEIFSQGSGAGGSFSDAFCDSAQQYIVAPGVTTGTTWVSWPNGWPLTGSPMPGLEYASNISGNDIIYELGIPMYDNYAGRPGSSGDTVVTQLNAGSVVRFDIVVDTRWGTNVDDFGVLAAADTTGRSGNASVFGKYTLVEQTPCGAWGYLQGDIDRNCVVNLKDFAQLGQQWMRCNNPADINCIANW